MAGSPGNKVVDVRQFCVSRYQTDGFEAVKTPSFLVTIQAVAAAGDVYATRIYPREQQLIIFVELYAHKVTRYPHRPGLFHQVPAGIGFKGEVFILQAFAQ